MDKGRRERISPRNRKPDTPDSRNGMMRRVVRNLGRIGGERLCDCDHDSLFAVGLAFARTTPGFSRTRHHLLGPLRFSSPFAKEFPDPRDQD